MFRYTFVFVIAALFLVAVQVNAEEELSDRANPAAKAVAKILGKQFAKAGGKCLLEAAEQCKSHWKHPKEAISCGKRFFEENKGRCAL